MADGNPDRTRTSAVAPWLGEGEQRVTLVFTDIVGSTRLKQVLGDRAGVERIQAHHQLVREMLAGFSEAVVAGTSGDSFLILFASPTEAIRFALRLQQGLRSDAAAEPHPVLDRIGLHTGTVVVVRKDDDLDVLGTDVDTAARIMALAGADQILLTTEVCEPARNELDSQPPAGLGKVRWQRHGAYRLRGLRRAVPVWEVGEEDLAKFRTPRRRYPGALPTSAWILIAAGLLLGSTLLQRFVPAWRPARALPAVNLAILPATATEDAPADRTLLEGMAQAVLDHLAHRKQEQHLALRLVPVADVLEERLVATSEVRRRFGATHVLWVGWRRDSDPVRLGITLYDAASEDTVGAQPIEARDSNLLGAAQLVADLTLDWLGFPPPGRGNAETARNQTANARAYRLYLQGLGELARYDPSLQASNAVAVLQAATVEDPGFAPAFAALSEAHWWMYQHSRDRTHIENALTSVLRAMELTTNRLAPAEYAAGLLRLGRGQASLAAESFQRALKLDPAYTRARTMLARAHEEAGDYGAAESIHQEAVRQDAGDWRAWHSLGVFYANRTDRYREAEQCFRRVTELTPDNYAGYANLGGLLFLQGRFDEAAELLEQSIALKPTAQASSNLATIRFFEGAYPAALSLTLQATELDPNDYIWWGNLADVRRYATPADTHATTDAYHRATALAEASLLVNPKQPQVLADLAVFHAFLGDGAAARAALAQALAQAPRDPAVLFGLALAHERIGERPAAVQSLRAALQAGYPRHTVLRHPDLRSLRQDPAAIEFLGEPDPSQTRPR